RPNRSCQSDDRQSAVREAKEASSLPRSACLHALEQPLVRPGRSIQACQELTIRLRANRKNGTIQQRVLGSATSRIQDKIRAVLAGEFRGSIDQFAHLRLDAEVERFAPAGLPLWNTHKISWNHDTRS